MLSQRLQQKLQQKLSPQQILLMKLLQVPTVALDQRIKQELEENPLLEDLSENREKDISDNGDEYENDYSDDNSRDTSDFDFNDYLDEDDVDSYKLRANNKSADEDRKETPYASEASFQESLTDQLMMLGLDEKKQTIGLTLIGNLDDSGYLMRDVRALVDDFAFSQNLITTTGEITEVLEIIQELDPPGVGARSLQECLLLQLQRNEDQTKSVQLAYKIINTQFDRFSKKHYNKIIEKLEITEEDLKAAIDEVLKLNPKPGSSIGGSSKLNQYVIPDFIITNINGSLELSLNNRNTPELRINQDYAELVQGYAVSKQKTEQQKDAVMFIKQKIDSARWFIDAIKQRQHTLYVTMNAIMNYQHEYFLEGDVSKLKPMKLQDVANIVNLDISTISRVANSKYAETHFGTFLLRDFFSKSMTNDAGEGISTTEIKRILKECIDNEDKTSPLNDDELTEILGKKGYKIARRTVAKYREGMDIRVARLRKEIS
ncbi:MAG: RNA polymerase factor sigma-54 [Bacteroidetes bacterium]|nr:RNA polymerase factor sigma-54 [Bacteroidota bacterium]